MPDLSLSELLRPEMRELSAYAPKTGEFAVRLDANEAPPLLPDRAKERLARAAASVAWERYPDAAMGELRSALAKRTGVSRDEVLAGTGSDEVITWLLTVLAKPRGRSPAATVVTTTPTFVMYRMSARARGFRVMEVPLDPQWDLDAGGLLRALEMSEPNLVFIASPNNPTGTLMSPDRLQRVVEAASSALVVIDEAYIDYAAGDHLELYRAHPNVALLRTLSKIGFAAARIGWLVARPELIAEIDKARQPYNVSSVSQRVGTLAVTDLAADVAAATGTVIAERDRVADELASLPGIDVTPSQANFLWIRTAQPAGEVYDALAERGVLVRSFHGRGGRLGHQLRVTTGTASENDTFLEALRGTLSA